MELAKYIDHTLLKSDATHFQIMKTVEEAKKYHFAGVCVNSFYLPLVAAELKSTNVLPVSVIGFPLGMMSTKSKAYETEFCVSSGAKEIDMVINIGALKDRQNSVVENDIREVVKACEHAKLKVIIETALLSEEEKELACKISLNAGAHFVKTCTGFNGGGATVDDIMLMKKIVGQQMQIKASGGIKTIEQAKALIAAGANRLGTSSGVALVTTGASTSSGY